MDKQARRAELTVPSMLMFQSSTETLKTELSIPCCQFVLAIETLFASCAAEEKTLLILGIFQVISIVLHNL